MPGTITFGGIGSGIDVESLISGLVSANSVQLDNLRSKQSSVDSAITALNDFSSLLGGLKNAVSELDTETEVGSYKASSSSDAVVATANGLALPGSYDVTVDQLAREQRTYSDAFASKADALGQTGQLTLQVGSGDPLNIDVEAGDNLEAIVGKINESGERVSASIFFDGSNYRLQVRGKDTGADSAIAFTETGIDLGLSDVANTVQSAQDAQVKIDGFTVTSSTNQITGAISGVTLALKDTTASPAKLAVETDPGALETKLRKVVDAYNSVINKIHVTSGFGDKKAVNAALAGDASLRSINTRLTDRVLTTVADAGTYQTLASIGVQFENNGTLKLDSSKLSAALEADPSSVTRLLAGDSDTDGMMDLFRSLVDEFTAAESGTLTSRQEGLEAEKKRLGDSVERENDRLDKYSEQLRKQFSAMDSSVASNNAQLQYLLSISG